MPEFVHFSIEFAGDKQLSRALGGMIGELDDLRPTFSGMVDVVFRATKKQFASVGRHGSGGWEPLTAKYAARKAAKYPGRPILVREGAMKASITDKNDAGAVVHLSPKWMGIGSSVEYWRFHQTGTSKMARRRPYDLTAREKHEFVAPLARRLQLAWLGRGVTGRRGRVRV